MRLCRMRISTIFQEAEAYLRTSEGENGKSKREKTIDNCFFEVLN